MKLGTKIAIGSIAAFAILANIHKHTSAEEKPDLSGQAETACLKAMQLMVKRPETFDFSRTASEATENGYFVQVHFSARNGYNWPTEFTGQCKVEAGKVVWRKAVALN